MKTFWKFIVFTGLLIQSTFAYSANHDAVITFQKENNTEFGKESLSTSHFIQPSIERGTPDLKHNNRIPVGLSSNTLLPLFTSLKENNIKIVLSNQDIDRCAEVSILLFPFHYFW
ncbi:hypothetical protein [Flavobacterium sp. 5]|uniref:hypothetical protein n=1 Tax=Flavobacterium sp. 5 TaxID=2035199 RepID=UPI000C2BBF13|nr:hypothetical protein [Flavobacterium sp. 5]PKB17910.1 hypothetical protein CLU82_3161 [Flavobacterium sp. 5]